jgi:hypothetical protein
MKKLSVFSIALIFLFAGMAVAADQKSKSQTQVQIDEFQKMTGDKILEKVRKINYVKMTDKDYIATYQKIYKKLASLDIKKDGTECIKVYVSLLNLNNCFDQGSSKNLTPAAQTSFVNEMSKGLDKITPEAWAGAMQQLQGTDEQLQKKLTDARTAKENFKNQMVENEAKSVIEQANLFPSDDFSGGIKKLQELKKKAPNSKVIADGLALLEKLKSNNKMIEVKALEVTSNPLSKRCDIQIANKSALKAAFFSINVSFLDANGKVLKTEETQCGAENMNPSSADGCAPGYVGSTWVSLLNEDALAGKWVKAAAKLKWVRFVVE